MNKVASIRRTLRRQVMFTQRGGSWRLQRGGGWRVNRLAALFR